MTQFSIWHWLIVVMVIALLFGGKGKIANLMGDFAKGIEAFKSGMNDESAEPPPARSRSPSSPTWTTLLILLALAVVAAVATTVPRLVGAAAN